MTCRYSIILRFASCSYIAYHSKTRTSAGLTVSAILGKVFPLLLASLVQFLLQEKEQDSKTKGERGNGVDRGMGAIFCLSNNNYSDII